MRSLQPAISPIARLRNRTSSKLAEPEPESRVARKDQYDALYRFYTEETERYEALNKRGSAYLGVVAGLSVFATFKLDAIAAKVLASPPTLILGLLTGTAVIACIAFVTLSLRIRDYRTVVDTRELTVSVDEDRYNVEDMYTVLLAGVVTAIESNRAINDDRARLLSVAVWFAVAALLLSFLTNIAVFSLVT